MNIYTIWTEQYPAFPPYKLMADINLIHKWNNMHYKARCKESRPISHKYHNNSMQCFCEHISLWFIMFLVKQITVDVHGRITDMNVSCQLSQWVMVSSLKLWRSHNGILTGECNCSVLLLTNLSPGQPWLIQTDDNQAQLLNNICSTACYVYEGNFIGNVHSRRKRSQQFNFFSREIFHLYRHHQTLLIQYYVLYNYVLYII